MRSGLFNNKSNDLIPLKEVNVKTEIVDLCASVTLTQVYCNTSTEIIETLYVFPLDEKSSVTNFSIEYDGNVLNGIITPKEIAKESYTSATKEGKFSSLMTQATSSAFTMNIGNIPPKTNITAKITYVTELKLLGNSFIFNLPTYIAPKYTSILIDNQLEPNFPSIKYSDEIQYELNFEAKCFMSSKIRHIISAIDNGEMKSIIENKTCIITFNNIKMKSDLSFAIELNDLSDINLFIEHKDGSNALMLYTNPHFNVAEQKTEFIFVVDCSASMDYGCKIKNTKQAMSLFIKSLPVDSYFNIYKFGSTYASLWPTSKICDEKSVKEANKYILDISADLGGTELLELLTYLLDLEKHIPIKNYHRNLMILTDGQVDNTQTILKHVKQFAGTTRIFTLGVGDADYSLINGLARIGNGTSKLTIDSKDIQKMIIGQLKDALQPVLYDVTLDLGISDMIQTPSHIPVISKDNGIIIYGMFNGAIDDLKNLSSITLKAKTNNGTMVKYVATIDLPKQLAKSNIIHKLAARSLIRELDEQTIVHVDMLEKKFIHGLIEKCKHNNGDNLDKIIVSISMLHNIISSKTSFVLVGNKIIDGSDVKKIQIPIYDPTHQQLMSINNAHQPYRGNLWPKLLYNISCVDDSFTKYIEPSLLSKISNFFKSSKKKLSKTKVVLIKDSKDIMYELINLQKHDGSFEHMNEFYKINKINKNILKKLTQLEKTYTKILIDTLFAINYLQNKYDAHNNEWNLIVDKSIKWVNKNYDKIIIDKINIDILEFIVQLEFNY